MKETQLFFFKMTAGCLKFLGKGFETMADLIETLTGVKKSPSPETAEPEKKAETSEVKPASEVEKEPKSAPLVSEVPEASEEKPAKTVEKAEKPKAARKRKPKAKKGTKKDSPVSAIDMVRDIIYNSESTVTAAQLKEKTGFEEKKIQNIVYKLKSRGQIKSPDKGIYQKP